MRSLSCTSSPGGAWLSPGSRSSTRRTFSARRASRWSSSPRRTTCFRSRSCLTYPSRSVWSATARAPTVHFGAHVVRRQRTQLHRSIKHLKREGFRNVWVLDSLEEIAAVEVTRTPLWTDRRAEHGPFDVIGDIHGCYDELVALLAQLGYAVASDGVTVTPPEGRRAVFVGDYGDRGPDTPAVLRLVMAMAARRHGDLPAREPRREAGAQAQRARRQGRPRARGDPRAARDGER